ncbi:lyase family protein [Carnimonas nigrificans]|uniref:lyase family protein n=1 Tax=Carnimonas nigrificans TaxID=64323 RepID=UPI000470B1A1|nr:lyase family protein [Carnimonas nigrificans]
MYDRFFRHPFMSRHGLAELDDRSVVEALCRVELALAQVEEEAGILPEGVSAQLAAVILPAHFDMDALAADVGKGGNVAIPFVKQAKAMLPEELRRYFHHGATSQDIVDSALMLLIKPRLEASLKQLALLRGGYGKLMRRYRDLPMIGRTLMQQAVPMTFGVKVAQWAAAMLKAEERLENVVQHGLFVQFGGPVGVHTGLGEHGLALMHALAGKLGLATPMLPWHTDRQPLLALMAALDGVAVGAEKNALDIALMCQSEVGELSEPAQEGVGGSSSMPHKSNPIGCGRIRAAARHIHAHYGVISTSGAQPLERGLGEWHAEWAPLLDAVVELEGALELLAALIDGLQVHEEAMARNLSHSLEALEQRPLAEYLGSSGAQVDRVLDALAVQTTTA